MNNNEDKQKSKTFNNPKILQENFDELSSHLTNNMIHSTISNNKPLIHLNEIDLFDTREKSESLISILKDPLKLLKRKSKIIALFGNWGSGKTTVLNHIFASEAIQDQCHCVYVNCWKYERNDNLQNVMMKLIEKSDKGRRIKINTKKVIDSMKKLIGASNLNYGFMGLGVQVNLRELLKRDVDFLSLEKEFKESYEKLENKLTDKKILIFIDELDRCDPENLINFLTTIKHFLTLGKKTIFLIAIDESAAIAAFKQKYNNNIKAEEYLEKIFDLSFTMPQPKCYELLKFRFCASNDDFCSKLGSLLQNLKFNNPRQLKKILNKQLVLQEIYSNNLFSKVLNSEDLLENAIVLYLIYLHDNKPKVFHDIMDFQAKQEDFKTIQVQYSDRPNSTIGTRNLSTFINAKNIKSINENFILTVKLTCAFLPSQSNPSKDKLSFGELHSDNCIQNLINISQRYDAVKNKTEMLFVRWLIKQLNDFYKTEDKENIKNRLTGLIQLVNNIENLL